MYDKKAMLKFQEKQKAIIKMYKEEVGCMNQKCFWKGPYKSEMLDFHHLDPEEKSFGLSSCKCHITRFHDELKKCTLLCANCHRDSSLSEDFERCPPLNYRKYLKLVQPELRNRSPTVKKTNGYSSQVGVTYHKHNKRWQVVIKGKYIGSFLTEKEAVDVAKNSQIKAK
jgi:hypothetical protein